MTHNNCPESHKACVPARRLGTLAVHAGEQRLKPEHAITDAIYCASTYTFPDSQALIDFIEQKQPREEYARYGNPSQRVLERKLAALEGGQSAIVFSCGMAALSGLLLAKLQAGDEIILFDECYHRSRELCTTYLGKFGVVARVVSTADYAALEAAVTPRTRLLLSESPTNPHLSVIDLERFAAIGRRHGVETVIDATLATPFNVRPLEWGIDYVIHSCTKYLVGHNDALAGAVIGSEEKLQAVRDVRGMVGLINSPQNEYLFLRGLKTFELRIRRQNENGLTVARFLESHPRIERVYYPGLPTHPHYDVARRQMRGFGGLVTFLVKNADWRQTADVVDAVRIPRIAQPGRGRIAYRATARAELP